MKKLKDVGYTVGLILFLLAFLFAAYFQYSAKMEHKRRDQAQQAPEKKQKDGGKELKPLK